VAKAERERGPLVAGRARREAPWYDVLETLDDSDDEIRRLPDWFRANLGAHVPLHFTAFRPDLEMMDVPPETPRRARAIAKRAGFRLRVAAP
jgi:pyruvate-formate lyase-activating enzyme